MPYTRSSALGSRTTTPVPLSPFQVRPTRWNTPRRSKSRARPSSAPFSRSSRSANLQGADPSIYSEDGHPFDRRSNDDGTRQVPPLERGTLNIKVRPRPTSSTPPMTPRWTAVRRREHHRGNLLSPWEDGSSAGGSRDSAGFDNRNRRYHPPPSDAEDCRSRAKEVVAEMWGKTGEGSRTQKETSAETKRGVAVVGSPYMSLAERSKEMMKESARMRKEINALRAEATASRNEANAAHKRFEDLERHVEAVLRDTAEVLPQYRDGRKASPKSRFLVMEHRKEIEKTVMVKRLREEVSLLVKQLADKENELSRLKRSCQFTALTEMHAAGEEYVKEVERLRAKLNSSSGQSHGGCNFRNNAHYDGVDITAVVRPSSDQSVKADDEPNSGSEFIEQQSSEDNRFVSSSQGGAHNNGGDRFNSASPKRHIDKGEGQEEWPDHAVSHSANSHCRHTRQREEHVFNGSRSNGTSEGRRVRKASVPGCFQPSRLSRRGISIDQPIRKRNVSPHGNRRSDWPKTGERINLNPRAELDVMTGLVLAQQQRIERQRARMLELERDLRDYRRAVAVGGEWPKESWPLPASLNRSRRRAGPNAGLTPSRSAPAGLGLWGEKSRGRSTTSVVPRYPNDDEQCRGKMKIGQEQSYKQKWRSRANPSKSTNGVADASEAQLPLSSCKGDSLRGNASGPPSLRRKSYPRGYSHGQSEGAVEGFHDGGGGFMVGEDALPEGWGQAVDERTGQVYYFCDGRSTWVRPTISPKVRNEHDVTEKNGGAATNNGNPAGSEPSKALIATTANGLADSLLAETRSTDEKSPRDMKFRDMEDVFENDQTAAVSDLWKDRLRERKSSESTPGQSHNQPVGIPLTMIRSLSSSNTIDTPNEGGLYCMGDGSASNPNNSGSLANDARRRQIEASDSSR